MAENSSVSGSAGRKRRLYATAAILLLAVEVFIALVVRDSVVRPYLGDVLAVMLVYAALRAATPLRLASALSIALTIALVIEIAQALNLLAALGLADNRLARVVLGGAFDMLDLAAYAAGGAVVIGVEFALRRVERGSAG